jgi:ATP synthase protein I
MSGAGISRPPVHRVSIAQTLVLLVVWAGLGFLDPAVAHSVLLGGLIAIVPQAWFTYRVFRWRGARSARQIARASYSGEIGKFVLAVTGFALVFAFVRPLQPLALFTAYGGMLIIQVIGTWYLLRDAQTRRP